MDYKKHKFRVASSRKSSGLRPLTILIKYFILDPWLGFDFDKKVSLDNLLQHLSSYLK